MCGRAPAAGERRVAAAQAERRRLNHVSLAMRFKGTIDIEGINPYVLVSAQRAARLKSGWKKPMPVQVQINGAPTPPWRINLMPRGDGSFYLYLHGNVRKASNTTVGDTVQVTLHFDEHYQGGPQHDMPAEFAARLKANAAAQAAWHALSPSRQKEVLRYFAGLKTEAAKARNYERALRVLSGKRERFMAREWNA